MLRRTFAAMGTDIELLLDAPGGPQATEALGAAEAEFHRLESLLSRFRPDSELARLNRDGAIVAGCELLEVTELAVAARARSHGRFDPTIHDALCAAGYHTSFDELDPGDAPAEPAGPCGGTIAIDRELCSITLGPDVRIDLGGIAKGYAVDRAREILAPAGRSLVNAGGDIAATGEWIVGVETAGTPISLAIDGGALATTGRDRRCWTRGGRELHHLIDPSTGQPATSDLLRVTAFAPTAVEAEVLAKTRFLAGFDGALEEAASAAAPCVLVAEDGRCALAGGLA